MNATQAEAAYQVLRKMDALMTEYEQVTRQDRCSRSALTDMEIMVHLGQLDFAENVTARDAMMRFLVNDQTVIGSDSDADYLWDYAEDRIREELTEAGMLDEY